ncbi:FadR family transcriptional regulator [Nocardioides immobilis]|uniref:FadR family transcriptional regulator n=1 Tax=Nocardioides immobilis TaxID=2049295 RepID=A0A417Y0N6_9ACTN|nr:GntR family transcriptional regulator [Nocardioides immobilis]RHW26222.1 FadR family transcriptional regulator [Nocardioides immobilis]
MQETKGPSRLQERIGETIAADIRRRVLRGTYPAGPLPKQNELAEEYGVSGPSLREALRILEAEGLITVRRGKIGGAFIHPPNWSSAAYALGLSLQGQGIKLADLAETIRDLEPRCAAACASREDRMSTVVPALEASIAESEAVVGDGTKFTTAARSFHHIMVDWSPNQTSRLVVRSLVAVWSIQEKAWADIAAAEGRYPLPQQQHQALDSHRHIVTALIAGDAEKVASIAADHLAATQSRVLEPYGDRVVDASSDTAMRAFRSL